MRQLGWLGLCQKPAAGEVQLPWKEPLTEESRPQCTFPRTVIWEAQSELQTWKLNRAIVILRFDPYPFWDFHISQMCNIGWCEVSSRPDISATGRRKSNHTACSHMEPWNTVSFDGFGNDLRRGRTEKQTPKRTSYGSLADRIFHADTSPDLEYWHLEYSKAGSIPSTRMEILLYLLISSVSNIHEYSRCRTPHVDRIRWKSWPCPSKQGFGMFWSSRKNTKIFQVQDCSSRYMLYDTG